MSRAEDKLKELGLTLPTPSAPAAAYVPYVTSGNLVFISGQLPFEDGKLNVLGRLGKEVDVPTAQRAAKACALNLIAHLKTACGGDLDKVVRCVKLGVFVASTPEFFDQPSVGNGASELMQAVFGDAGKHSRAAVGVAVLPKNVAVEVEGVFEIRN